MHLFLSLFLSLILALFAYFKKAMTNGALILAFICSCFITYFGGLLAYFILVVVFALVVIAGNLKSVFKENAQQNINLVANQKDVESIIANVLPGTIALIIFGITKNNNFLIVYAALMAEAIADSLASDIGILSNKEPYNILTLKKSTPGLSGNISLLGMSAALVGSMLIALIYTIFNPQIKIFLIITLCGFLGNLLDSFLGAILQVKYKCPKCNLITEKEVHCEVPTKHYKGLKIFNNETINFISNILSGIICYLLI